MDTGGPSQKEEAQRQAAAAIARRKVLAAYENQGASRLKDAPKGTTIDSESWKKYHTAWQDYYQKYYSEYYAKAARTYIEQERLKAARDNTDGLAKPTDFSAQHSSEITEDDSLREHIRKKATDSAKKSRRHRRLIPIFAGLAVVIAILFLQYNRLIFAPIMAYISPGNVPPSEIEAIDPTVDREISAEPKLIIPKLNIDVPIRFDVAIKDVMSAMNNGVALYRIAGASAYQAKLGISSLLATPLVTFIVQTLTNSFSLASNASKPATLSTSITILSATPTPSLAKKLSARPMSPPSFPAPTNPSSLLSLAILSAHREVASSSPLIKFRPPTAPSKNPPPTSPLSMIAISTLSPLPNLPSLRRFGIG